MSDRTVRRAVDRGLIRGHRSSPNKLEIPAEERRYLAEHWRLLQKLVNALRTEPSVQTAILHGSTARGDKDDTSDVDLVVVWRPGSRVSPLELVRRLERVVGREVDIISLDRAAGEPQFMLEVVRDGRPLVDRGGRWSRLRRERATLLREARKRRAQRNEAAAAVWAELG